MDRLGSNHESAKFYHAASKCACVGVGVGGWVCQMPNAPPQWVGLNQFAVSWHGIVLSCRCVWMCVCVHDAQSKIQNMHKLPGVCVCACTRME